jgi:hypothetical protein
MTAKVIKGPWQNCTLDLEKAKLLSTCDQMTSECIVSLLQHFVEYDIAPEDPDDENITFIIFLTEVIRAIIYKNSGYEHPLQDLVQLLTDMEIDIDNSKHYFIDYVKVREIIDFLNTIKDNEPA